MALAVLLLFIAAIIAGITLYTGKWHLNNPDHEVRGVDVSHYQGMIDWPVLASQDVDFAFVKATEGSIYRDETFDANWYGARASGLRTGAYHFFSYDSPGADQAANYINTVPMADDMLPPVIDIEFYGDYYDEPMDPETAVVELSAMIDALRAHYGMRPILYVTDESYELYVADRFEDCDIWIRSTFSKPSLPDGRAWTFWQYTDREKLEGYTGTEAFIDMNVYSGTAAEFSGYPAG